MKVVVPVVVCMFVIDDIDDMIAELKRSRCMESRCMVSRCMVSRCMVKRYLPNRTCRASSFPTRPRTVILRPPNKASIIFPGLRLMNNKLSNIISVIAAVNVIVDVHVEAKGCDVALHR